MTRIMTPVLMAAALTLPVGAASSAAARGTPDEARAMLAKAVAHYKAVGRKQALADFTGKKPPFFDRDLYVVCLAADHTVAANGAFPAYVGAAVDVLKDAEGKPIGRAFWDTAIKGGESVTYPMINPATGRVERKIGFVQKVGDDVCAVGAYNPQ